MCNEACLITPLFYYRLLTSGDFINKGGSGFLNVCTCMYILNLIASAAFYQVDKDVFLPDVINCSFALALILMDMWCFVCSARRSGEMR